jgi:hypothetical protein
MQSAANTFERMVDLRTHLRKAARARWSKATKAEKQAAASKASRAYWDALSPEERSVEMRRRAAKRKKRKR